LQTKRRTLSRESATETGKLSMSWYVLMSVDLRNRDFSCEKSGGRGGGGAGSRSEGVL